MAVEFVVMLLALLGTATLSIAALPAADRYLPW